MYPLGPHSRIGLGLEGICREEYDAILAGEGYLRRTDDMIRENFSD